MKQKLFCILIFLSGMKLSAQETFSLKVSLDNFNSGTPFLSYMKGDKYILETRYQKEGNQLIFTGSVDGAVIASFGVRNEVNAVIGTNAKIRMPLSFVLTNEQISIVGHIDDLPSSAVMGGKFTQAYNDDKAKLKVLEAEERTLADAAAAKGDSTGLKLMQGSALMNESLKRKFIDKYPASILSMLYLYTLSSTMELAPLKTAYSKMSDLHKGSIYAMLISTKIASLEKNATGKQAVEIDKTDLYGKRVSLASLKGKYVLLDFWGSWCGPCRASHPHLKQLYSKYKTAGFEIVGIAQEQKATLEENNSAWKKAITEDGIQWIHVLNNLGIEKNDVVKDYGVSVFPTKMLLDKEGKVLGRYIGDGHEIDEALSRLFGF